MMSATAKPSIRFTVAEKNDLVPLPIKVSVKENEVPTEKNSSRASIFATKASYISN